MKGIEFEYRAVNLVSNHQVSAAMRGCTFARRACHGKAPPRCAQLEGAYASLNPQCVVPTLEIDGQVMTQSVSKLFLSPSVWYAHFSPLHIEPTWRVIHVDQNNLVNYLL